jgi:hypothetical protein
LEDQTQRNAGQRGCRVILERYNIHTIVHSKNTMVK